MSSAGRHVANFYSMLPNKKGPVELLLLECARQWVATGGRLTAYFIDEPVPWFAEAMSSAGVEFGAMAVTDRASWNAEVLRIASDIKPDLVHYHFAPHTSAKALTKQGMKAVRTEHSGRLPQRLEPLRRVVRHWQQRPLSGFVAVADIINLQTRRDFIVPARRVETIQNGVDTQAFRPRPEQRAELRRKWFGIDDDRVVIAQAAHLTPRKRQRMLIEALPSLLTQNLDVHLVLAGAGDDEATLRALVTELGLGERVIILTGDNDIAEIYAASDIATLVSTTEGLPGSGIEALACGLPLVITPNGGSVEVVEDGVSGVFLHDQSVAGLASILASLTVDPQKRARLGQAARQRAESVFDLRVTAQKTVQFWSRILAS